MNLTYEYLTNNVEESLKSKVLKTYLNFPPQRRGGPLFFKIMINILQNNSNEAAKYLIQTVKDIEITNYAGENVSTVVSLIRGATNRLNNLENKYGKSQIPEDFITDIIKIFMTTSVPEYNELFSHFQRTTKLSEFISGKKSQKTTITTILTFAEEQYIAMVGSGLWTGVNKKLNETYLLQKQVEVQNALTVEKIIF